MSTTEPAWFKSSCSGTQGDSCVEVAVTGQAICIRDSKVVTRPHFSVQPADWTQFVQYVARG